MEEGRRSRHSMMEDSQLRSRPKKSKSRRSRSSRETSERKDPSFRTKSDAPKVAQKPVNTTSITNETSVDITHHECELDNDTAALMSRLEKKYHRTATANLFKPVVTPPSVAAPNDADKQARLARWEEHYEAESSSASSDSDDDEETQTDARFAALHKQMSSRSLFKQLSKKSLAADTLSQGPSVISEQYLESVEDLPFDDDSFVPLMNITPIQDRHPNQQGNSIYSGTESSLPRPRKNNRRSTHDIHEGCDNRDEDSSYPPPVSEIELNIPDNTNASVAVEYQSEKLSQFLKANGQDEQVAAATAQAFEAFLISQEQAMLQLIPEGDICEETDSSDSESSFSEDEEAFRPPRPSRQSSMNAADPNVYAKLAAIQKNMNNAQRQQQNYVGSSIADGSATGFSRSSSRHQRHGSDHHSAVGSSRHSSSRRGGKENRYRGMQRQGESERYFYGSARSFAQHPSDEDPEYVEQEHISSRSRQMRGGRYESKRSVRSDRRSLGRDFDSSSRMIHRAEPSAGDLPPQPVARSQRREQYDNDFRQSGRITPEYQQLIDEKHDQYGQSGRITPDYTQSREEKLDKYNDFRQSGRTGTTHGSSSVSAAPNYASNRNVGSSLMPNPYLDGPGTHPRSVGSGSSLSGHTSPPVSVRSERTFEEQIQMLPISHRACYNALKSKWELKSGGKKAFPDELYLRFAMCSNPAFDFKSAWQVMKRFDRRYLNLSVTSMEKRLVTKTIFPVAGLKSRAGNDMLYMRPSRFFPGKDSVEQMIDCVVYTMGTMLEKEQACNDGIGVIFNMTDWKMANFSVKYWHKLMMTLQGKRVPTRVTILLIVNPPSWFGSIWAIMRPMLSEPLRSNVLRIPFHDMDRYLANGFERFLPDEMHTGYNKTSQIVRDFIMERKSVEKMQQGC